MPLSGYSVPVLVSPGTEPRSTDVAARADRAYRWLCEQTGRSPQFTLFVVGRNDWDTVAEVPLYGMPQALPGKVVTSPDPADWWVDYVDALRPHLPADELDRLDTVFGDPHDFTTLADLVVTHEITHLFHEIDPVTWASEFPEDWVMELFANLGMWGYLAEVEPDDLILLSTMVSAARAVGPHPWPMRELGLMGQSMQASTSNYVWYEFMLIGLAQSIWETGGAETLPVFQRTLGDPTLDRATVVDRLRQLDPAVADAVRDWPS